MKLLRGTAAFIISPSLMISPCCATAASGLMISDSALHSGGSVLEFVGKNGHHGRLPVHKRKGKAGGVRLWR